MKKLFIVIGLSSFSLLTFGTYQSEMIQNVSASPIQDEYSMMRLNVEFIHEGRIVGFTVIDGNVGDTVDITNYLPKGYSLATEEPRMVTLYANMTNGTKIRVDPKKHDFKVNYLDIDKDFKLVGESITRSVFPEFYYSVQEHLTELPKGYIVSYKSEDSYSTKNTDKLEEFNVYVKYVGEEIPNVIIFHDSETGFSFKKVLKGKLNDELVLNHKILPEGYYFGDRHWSKNNYEYTIIPFEREHVVEIIKKAPSSIPGQDANIVTNYIRILDEFGEAIGHKEVVGKIGDIVDLNKKFKHYDFGSKKEYQIKPQGNFISLSPKIDVVKNKFKIVDSDDPSHVLTDCAILEGEFESWIDWTDFSQIKIEGYAPSPSNGHYMFDDEFEEIRTFSFAKAVTNQVQFITPEGNQVSKTSKTGVDKQSIDVEAPEGYEIPANYLHSIILSKNNSIQHVVVIKKSNLSSNNAGHQTSTSNPSTSYPQIGGSNKPSIDNEVSDKFEQIDFVTVISTHPSLSSVPLFNLFGKLTIRSLSANTAWKVDKKVILNGELFFRVSTNEWVKASSVFQYTYEDRTITTKNGESSKIINSSGKVSNRGLRPNTKWYTDRSRYFNGSKYFRVSTDEWVAEADLQ
jgi:hypothetical protein